MEFQVPQFIEQKAKIVGPLTIAQFFYIAGAGAISFVAYNALPIFLWIIVTIVAGGIAVALAFVKINGQDMIKTAGSLFRYFLNQKMYTWQRQTAKTTLELSDEDLASIRKSMGVQSKLKSLTLKISFGRIFTKSAPAAGEENGGKYQVVTYLTGEQKVAKRIDY